MLNEWFNIFFIMIKKQELQKKKYDLSGIKLVIVVAKYNRQYTKALEKKCLETLKFFGLKDDQLDVYRVPGAFEIPLKCQELAKLSKYDAIIALGMVLKGDTYHFELVANESARGVMDVMLKYHIPIIFEVLACFNQDDADRRAGDDDYNRGIEAAQAALTVISTRNDK